MRSASALVRPSCVRQLGAQRSFVCRQCRALQISASAATESPQLGGDAFGTSLSTSEDVAGKLLGAQIAGGDDQLISHVQMPDSRS